MVFFKAYDINPDDIMRLPYCRYMQRLDDSFGQFHDVAPIMYIHHMLRACLQLVLYRERSDLFECMLNVAQDSELGERRELIRMILNDLTTRGW